MIRCRHLSFHYALENPVLREVDLHLAEGSFTFLSGPSGAGKSSLLGLLSLALKPTGGDLELFGRDIRKTEKEHLPFLRRKIGTVFQDYQLLEHLTVGQNVALPLKIQGEATGDIQRKVDELLKWVGLEETHNSKPKHLSGGQKQRISIARAVITNPKVILADEPTGNLDPELSMRFMYLFEQLNKNGTTVLFATHDETLMRAFNYPKLYLQNGKLQRGLRPQVAA